MHSFLVLTSQLYKIQRNTQKEDESTTARIISAPAVANRWLTRATDATVCSGDDGKRPGLIRNVKSLVSSQRHSCAWSVRCGSPV